MDSDQQSSANCSSSKPAAALPIISVTTPPSLPPADAAITANNVTAPIGKFTADDTAASTKAKTPATSATTTSAQVEDKTDIDPATPPCMILDVTQPGAVQSWCVQHKTWAAAGNVLQAHYNDVGVVVYQAFDREIASWAVKHQKFGGIWSPSRMTWIKTNFLWMMYRSGWGTKDRNQSNILAITISRTAFEAILAQTWMSSFGASSFDSRSEWAKAKPARGTGVRLQWDPCHDPLGHKHPARRAIQLGLAASVVATLWNTRECILGIQDITAFVAAQKRKIDAGTWRTDGGFVTPTEKPYPLPASLAARICTSTVSLQDARAVKLSVRERENASRKKKKKVPRMHVCEPYLHFLASGVKTHEGRVFKGTWRTLQPGDVIVFFNEEGKTPGADAGLAFRVTELRRYSDFDKAFEDLGKKLVPEGAETPAEAVEVYRQFNPKSVVDANDGVVCVGVTLLKEGSEGVQSSVASEVDGVDASDST